MVSFSEEGVGALEGIGGDGDLAEAEPAVVVELEGAVGRGAGGGGFFRGLAKVEGEEAVEGDGGGIVVVEELEAEGGGACLRRGG